MVTTLLALLLTPLAEARMVLSPSELRVVTGGSATFTISLFNEQRASERYLVRLDGGALDATLDRSDVVLVGFSSTTLTATVHAPSTTVGPHTLRVVLLEGSPPVEVERRDVRVLVVPPAEVAATLVGVTVVGALAGLAASRRWQLLAAALYTRLRRERIAEHPSRARILSLVREQPGMLLADAQRNAGLANGPFEHHVAKLVEARLLVIVPQGRSRALQLPGAAAVPQSLGPTATAVARLVRERREIRASEAADELNLSRQALHYHVRALVKEGVVAVRLDRGRLTLRAT